MKHLIVTALVLEALAFGAARASAQDPAAPPPPPPPAQPSAPPAYTPPPPAAPAPSSDSGTGKIRDNTITHRPMALSAMLWAPWWRGFGVGAVLRFEIPIVQNGFISSLNNHISLEPSFGFAFTSWDYGPYDADYIDIVPALFGTWSFHFSSEFRVYGGIGLGYAISSETGDYDYDVDDGSYFYIDGMAGVFYKLGDAIALRGEVGSGGPKGGIAFLF